MKKFLVALFIMAMSTSSFAFWVNPRIIINPPRTYAEAQVVNTWARPIVCRGQVNFQTRTGRVLFAYFNNAVIYPGQVARSFVYTNYYEPFMFGNGSVNCFFY